jgi:hypothetical protein
MKKLCLFLVLLLTFGCSSISQTSNNIPPRYMKNIKVGQPYKSLVTTFGNPSKLTKINDFEFVALYPSDYKSGDIYRCNDIRFFVQWSGYEDIFILGNPKRLERIPVTVSTAQSRCDQYAIDSYRRNIEAIQIIGIIGQALTPPSYSSDVYVNGYTRSNGAYVKPHYRTAPNDTEYDNYSTYPNINPYTGKQGTKR